jgi:hypothetical protein
VCGGRLTTRPQMRLGPDPSGVILKPVLVAQRASVVAHCAARGGHLPPVIRRVAEIACTGTCLLHNPDAAR